MKTPRKKLTKSQTHQAYLIAKYTYDNGDKMTMAQGAEDLHLNYNVSPGTAPDLIRNFHHLMKGEVFKRALNQYTMRHYLKNIKQDYGTHRLRTALSALIMHIIYREEGNTKTGRKPVKQKAMRNIYYDFSERDTPSDNLTQDEIEQENIIREVGRENRSKESLTKEIQRLTNTSTPTIITTTTSSYKRENQIIALIKLLRGQKCQICETFILKKNGGYYVEAAHIKPKHQGGEETLENIILLCPNHHKEFDLGDSHVTLHKDSVTLVLNGTPYTLLFLPKT